MDLAPAAETIESIPKPVETSNGASHADVDLATAAETIETIPEPAETSNGTGQPSIELAASEPFETTPDATELSNGSGHVTVDPVASVAVEFTPDTAEAAEAPHQPAAPTSEETDGTDQRSSLECPGCGEVGMRTLFRASDRLYQTTDKYFLLVECKTCRLIRLEPRPTPSELTAYYPPEYWYAPERGAASGLTEAYRRFVLRDHVKFVLRAIQNAGENGLVLDVGCGGGLFLKMLGERGYPVLGLETSHLAARAARKHNRVAVVCGELGSSPVDRGSCSVITMFHVLEHLHDPVSYLRSARDLLRPGGRLVVQVPNASCWQFLMFGENWSGVDVPRHLVNYRESDLVNLLEYCGFEVLRRKHFSLRDNPAGLASSLVPGLDPMARRVRRVRESLIAKLGKDLLYFGTVLASLPFTLFEAACGAGSTIMVEARTKS